MEMIPRKEMRMGGDLGKATTDTRSNPKGMKMSTMERRLKKYDNDSTSNNIYVRLKQKQRDTIGAVIVIILYSKPSFKQNLKGKKGFILILYYYYKLSMFR